MLVVGDAEQQTARPQGLDDLGVVVVDQLPLEVGDPVVEAAVRQDRVLQGHPVFLPEPEVVLAEGERGMDQAGAILGGDEVPEQHRVAERPEVGPRDVVEGGLIADPLELGPGEGPKLLPVLSEHPLGERPSNDEHLLGALRPPAHVVNLSPDGNGRMRDQRPWRGGPDEQRVAVGDDAARRWVFAADRHRQPHIRARIDLILVPERDLVRAQRSPTARAVGHDLVALVEAVAVPVLSQRPPDRLDVVVVEGPVGVVHVDPEADPFGQRLPVVDVAEHRVSAALVELGDSELLDPFLRGDAELLLDLQLHRQPMAVPARLARHEVAAHRLVARVDVLEDAREHVVGAGAPVGGRRALVEAPDRCTLALGELAGEDVALPPALEHPLLQSGEGLLGVHGLVSGCAGHEPAILRSAPGPAPIASEETSSSETTGGSE